jgi:DNA-binding protein H-NS
MTTLSELLAQKAALEKQILETQREERSAAITKVKDVMAEYGLTLADIAGKGTAPAPRKAAAKVPAKYRDPATGDSWSGRGLQPKWLKAALGKGKTLADFAV